jgi:hypothetical protein
MLPNILELVDPNLDTAYQWACELLQPQTLPLSLNDVTIRAQLVKEINDPFIVGHKATQPLSFLSQLSDKEKAIRLCNVGEISSRLMSDVSDANIRKNIAIRIWSGCLDAAKNISFRTMDGPVTPQIRQLSFFIIDHWTSKDLIYGSGIQCAPAFKKLHRQYYTFNGVPPSSIVRSFPNEYLLDG